MRNAESQIPNPKSQIPNRPPDRPLTQAVLTVFRSQFSVLNISKSPYFVRRSATRSVVSVASVVDVLLTARCSLHPAFGHPSPGRRGAGGSDFLARGRICFYEAELDLNVVLDTFG